MPRRCRPAPLILTLLVPSLAWAAPPDDGPAVQRPSQTASPDAPEPAPDASEAAPPSEAPPSEAPPSEAAEAPVTETPTGAPSTHPSDAETPTEPGEAASTDLPEAAAPEQPEQPEQPASAQPEQKDLSNLLVSDEPEAPAPRLRVADDRNRVDRSERLRNYYARIYRPEHNPARIHFNARAAFGMAGTNEGNGGGRLGFANVELGQTWNFIGYGVGAAVFAGDLTFGENGVEKFGGVLVGGGPSLGLGRLGLFGRGYLDVRLGYNFFYAPISTTRPELSDPPDAAPHGPKAQIDVGLLLHDSERRRFRHGLGATIGWQMLVHSFAGEYPRVNSFLVGVGYFFG